MYSWLPAAFSSVPLKVLSSVMIPSKISPELRVILIVMLTSSTWPPMICNVPIPPSVFYKFKISGCVTIIELTRLIQQMEQIEQIDLNCGRDRLLSGKRSPRQQIRCMQQNASRWEAMVISFDTFCQFISSQLTMFCCVVYLVMLLIYFPLMGVSRPPFKSISCQGPHHQSCVKSHKYSPWAKSEQVFPLKERSAWKVSPLPVIPSHLPFWIQPWYSPWLQHPNPSQIWSQVGGSHPSSQVSQSSPVQPGAQESHCPAGPKFEPQVSQLSPVHPLLHFSVASLR